MSDFYHELCTIVQQKRDEDQRYIDANKLNGVDRIKKGIRKETYRTGRICCSIHLIAIDGLTIRLRDYFQSIEGGVYLAKELGAERVVYDHSEERDTPITIHWPKKVT